MFRLVVVLGSIACAICALSIGSAPASAATVAVTGAGATSKIVITYESSTAESVTIGGASTSWTITGDATGTLTIPMSDTCNIQVVDGTAADNFTFSPSVTVTSTLCSTTIFGLNTTSFLGSQTVGGTVQMTSPGANAVSLSGPVTLSALTNLNLGNGVFTITGPVSIAGNPITLTAATVVITGNVAGVAGSARKLVLDVFDPTNQNQSSIIGSITDGGSDGVVSVEKGGRGTLTLTGTSTFTGVLNVAAGNLIVNGTMTPSSTTVEPNATIASAGAAAIASPLTFASSSSFGIGTSSPYKLTVGTITSTTSAPLFNVVVERTTTPGTDYTQIESTGSADLRGFDFWTHGFIAPFGTTITPLRTASGITSLPTRYPEGSYYDAWRISYATNGGRDMTWTFVGQVPVIVAVSPSTSPVTGGGLLTITGAQFYDGTEVRVGGAECSNATRVTVNTMTCTLPAHVPGAADVTVTNVSRSATLVGAITYDKPITPSTDTAGTPTGGTTTRTLAIGTPRVVGTKLVTTITAPGVGVITQTAITGTGRKATTRCRVRRAVATATDVTVTCALNARARAALSQSSLRLTVTTTFTPTGGMATTRIANVTAKRTITGKRALLP
jgi:autotransporter-associated beta strand protein